MRRELHFKLVVCGVVGLACAALAKDPRPVQRGTLVQMETVPCSDSDKANADAVNKMQGALCDEYLLQSERVNYRIRPRDAKHAALLPIGETAQFHLEKDAMLLRVDDLVGIDRNVKERRFVVVSMTPRSDSTAADATPIHLNHLQ